MGTTDTYLLDRGGQLLDGRYRVSELLGVGAMGSVWIAEHLALRRTVVVKFHEAGFVGMAGERARARFLREIHALASVRHRNVTELHEAGTTAAGEPYLIMEQLRGETLASRLRRGRVDVLDALAITVGIGRGLEAVHQAGVVHRDVKPENVFIHRDADDAVVPKLLDFGLAREDVDAPARLSGRSSSTIGTPGYMAPEQALGRDDLDGCVDQYALAACLYEMLTDRLPAEGREPREILWRTVNEDAPPLARLRPDLPPELGSTVERALSREREDRFPRVRDLADAIERIRRAL